MYFSHSFVLAILPFFTAANPLAVPPASRGIAIPIAKRANSPLVDPSLIASQVQNSIAKIETGMAAFQRNTGRPHPLAGGINASSKRATGSVPLTGYHSSLWYGTLAIGTPPVKFTMDFDTGSSDLIVPSTRCGSSCSGPKRYNATASSTSIDLQQNFHISYGDGSTVVGEQFTDFVSIAGPEATSQTLGAALFYSDGHTPSGSTPDGMMGMGFKDLSVFGANPVFQTLVAEGAVDSAVFGFKLAPSGSELFLGGVNPNYNEEDFTWVDLILAGYWQAYVDVITVTVEGFIVPVLGLTEVIFDTGTTMIIGDHDGIQRLYYQLTGSLSASEYDGNGVGIYTIPCNFSTLISFYFGEKEVKISPDTFNLGPVSGGSDTCIGGAASSAGLPVSNDLSKLWILGDVFLRNAYTAWDVENERIGFADLV